MKTPSLHLITRSNLGAAALILALATTAGCTTSEAQDAETIETLSKKTAPLSQADQEALAKSIFKTLARADEDAEPAFYERHYMIVTEKCPDTKRAHESYWRLTNLYRQAYDEPRLGNIVKILEQFLERYKTSTVVSMSKYPADLLTFSPIGSLHRAYEELGQYDKIAAYYDRITAATRSLNVQEYFDYATALDETERGRDALQWYEKFLNESKGKQGHEFLRSIAKERVQELKQN